MFFFSFLCYQLHDIEKKVMTEGGACVFAFSEYFVISNIIKKRKNSFSFPFQYNSLWIIANERGCKLRVIDCF